MRKPYLVACSGFINQEIKNKAIDSGFDLVIEQPLNVQTLRNHIIPKTIELKNQNEKRLESDFSIELSKSGDEQVFDSNNINSLSVKLDSLLDSI